MFDDGILLNAPVKVKTKGNQHVIIKRAENKKDKSDVMQLRHQIYVEDQERISDVTSMGQTFDLYEKNSQYFIAYENNIAAGAIKTIKDSEQGLPCETVLTFQSQRSSEFSPVEFGHLLMIPSLRSTTMSMALMRVALIYCIHELHATHILGDFFVNSRNGYKLQGFYRSLGFEMLHGPYQDHRFNNSPESAIGILSIENTIKLWKNAKGAQKKLLDYFFWDHETLKNTYSLEEQL
jgi:predicted GNAT family N-acyltransferase